MTATVLAPAVAPVTAEPGQSDELTHDWCCDRDRGLCGADLTGTHTCPEDFSCGCQQCAVCDDLLRVPCSPACDYFWDVAS